MVEQIAVDFFSMEKYDQSREREKENHEKAYTASLGSSGDLRTIFADMACLFKKSLHI